MSVIRQAQIRRPGQPTEVARAIEGRRSQRISMVLHGAEAALPLLELLDRAEEVLAAEVGPQHVREAQLGVCDLPEQIVRDAMLTGGSHQQVRVGHVRRIQVLVHHTFVDAFGIEAAGGDVTGDRAYVVVPATYTYKQKGKPVTESDAVWIFAMQKLASGWRIAGWAWAQH